ncbi:hypothetical protein PB1_03080 [Bacillus methanolicus PB1]|uniref:Uncharacterized protein n=1 Tax=Bacillus methanolicus PB1 TaxID=997296 RepID=I3E5W8_BACMT|nr:hypothetical protein PB1_03080 [Bacillus methanolicus PB1]
MQKIYREEGWTYLKKSKILKIYWIFDPFQGENYEFLFA